jgi:hypothetical protein
LDSEDTVARANAQSALATANKVNAAIDSLKELILDESGTKLDKSVFNQTDI